MCNETDFSIVLESRLKRNDRSEPVPSTSKTVSRFLDAVDTSRAGRWIVAEKNTDQRGESVTNKRASRLRGQDRPKIDEKFAKLGRLAGAHKVSGVNHLVLWWCTFANL